MKYCLILLLLTRVSLVYASCFVEPHNGQHWPPKPVIDCSARIAACTAEYRRQGADWRLFAGAGAYQPLGDYLNWSRAT